MYPAASDTLTGGTGSAWSVGLAASAGSESGGIRLGARQQYTCHRCTEKHAGQCKQYTEDKQTGRIVVNCTTAS
jgi:hypothetical protein